MVDALEEREKHVSGVSEFGIGLRKSKSTE
jgi:hypothetical protein